MWTHIDSKTIQEFIYTSTGDSFAGGGYTNLMYPQWIRYVPNIDLSDMDSLVLQ